MVKSLLAQSLGAVKIDTYIETWHKNNGNCESGIVGAGNIVRTRHLPALKRTRCRDRRRLELDLREQRTILNIAPAPPMANWADLRPCLILTSFGSTSLQHSAVTISSSSRPASMFLSGANVDGPREAKKSGDTKRF